jgi:hypothetical protein
MSEQLNRLARLALAALSPEELRHSNVYVNPQLYEAGAVVPVGRQTVIAARPSLLVFYLLPGANWAHPSKYLLVGTDGETIKEIDGQFPPPREQLRLLHRGEGAEDWTLLTRAGFG